MSHQGAGPCWDSQGPAVTKSFGWLPRTSTPSPSKFLWGCTATSRKCQSGSHCLSLIPRHQFFSCLSISESWMDYKVEGYILLPQRLTLTHTWWQLWNERTWDFCECLGFHNGLGAPDGQRLSYHVVFSQCSAQCLKRLNSLHFPVFC